MGESERIAISEELARIQERIRSLTVNIQDIQLQQQELERKRQELLAELLRLEGEARVLQRLNSAKNAEVA